MEVWKWLGVMWNYPKNPAALKALLVVNRYGDSNRRRTNVQQLTCKMVWSFSFYSLLFSFIILGLKQQ